jgi:serine/threonine protein phosphatase PrpC
VGFICAYHTDKGIEKQTNQDAVLLMEAQTVYGSVLLAAICDGLGGLTQGEVASATVCAALREWFLTELPALLEKNDPASREQDIKGSWEEFIRLVNARILGFGTANRVMLGTTLVALLLLSDQYFIVNVGDSRVYQLSDTLCQLTVDQTVAQCEVDSGLLSEASAASDPRSNVLLQCLGASETVTPRFHVGAVIPPATYLLCSDGFRRLITPQEIRDCLDLQRIRTEGDLQASIVYLAELNKRRFERDNISVIAVKVG